MSTGSLPWAATLAVTVIVAVATVTVVQRTQVDPFEVDAEEIARLAPDPGFVLPEAIALDGSTSYGDFFGLRPFTHEFAATEGVPYGSCLNVALTSNLGNPRARSIPGPIYRGCSAGSFPPLIVLRITENMPEDLRAAFPGRTVLRFVFDPAGREVVVYRDTRP